MTKQRESIIIGGAPVYFADVITELDRLIRKRRYSSFHVLCDLNTYKSCWPLLDEVRWPEKPFVITMEPGEGAKNLNTCRRVWNALVDNRADRRSLFISLGGGVVTDLGGFCASTFMRGMLFGHIPTSLMGMTDAAIGGKHGVDFGKLKNYLGIFNQPDFVLIDVRFLESLPPREFRNGLAEVIKHAALDNRELLERMGDPALFAPDRVEEVLKTSVQIKQNFVDSDVYDRGIRAALNFGHTVGHAIESILLKTANPILHGEAVALGMLVEAELSRILAGLSDSDAGLISGVIRSVFNDIALPAVDMDIVHDLVFMDKKRTAGVVQFSLLSAIGNPSIGQPVDRATLEKAWANCLGQGENAS